MKILKRIIICLFFLLSSLTIFLTIFIKKEFNDVSFEQLLYSLRNSEGTSLSAIIGGIIFVLIGIIVFFTFLIILNKIIKKSKYQYNLIINIKKKQFNINLFPIFLFQKLKFSIIFLLCSLIFMAQYLGIFGYIKNVFRCSTLFEDNYINPKEVKVTFPKEKKNLIYIYVESLEMTLASKKNNGAEEKSLIPEMETLANENTNFSNSDKLGGALHSDGAGWTAGAIIGHTSSIPLKVSINGNEYSGYGKNLPGAYSIAEVLKDNGYHNYFMMGSDANFGGRKEYLKQHGNYTFYDYKWAKKTKRISKNYNVWWGYEDKKLYEYAKEKLTEIAKKDEPFNFTMLTADTHFPSGYLDEICPTPYDDQYSNVFNCTSIMLNDFINWIKEQDFYKDTVVVITGDHLTMQADFFDNIDASYQRNIYNTFINSDIKPKKEKNRLFNVYDMYPTTLAALGCNIKGERLGLGTNLYSNEKTLIEKLGYEYFEQELQKNSQFYNNYLLGDSYYKILEKEEEKEE